MCQNNHYLRNKNSILNKLRLNSRWDNSLIANHLNKWLVTSDSQGSMMALILALPSLSVIFEMKPWE